MTRGPKVCRHRRGRRKHTLLMRTSMIFSADIHQLKDSRKLCSHEVWSVFLAPTLVHLKSFRWRLAIRGLLEQDQSSEAQSKINTLQRLPRKLSHECSWLEKTPASYRAVSGPSGPKPQKSPKRVKKRVKKESPGPSRVAGAFSTHGSARKSAHERFWSEFIWSVSPALFLGRVMLPGRARTTRKKALGTPGCETGFLDVGHTETKNQ